MIKTDDLTIPEEPEAYDKKLLKLGVELETIDHISWRLHKERVTQFYNVPKEKRQKILSEFQKGGITIGELAKKHELTSDVVSHIIFFNIKQASYLGSETR